MEIEGNPLNRVMSVHDKCLHLGAGIFTDYQVTSGISPSGSGEIIDFHTKEKQFAEMECLIWT